MLRVYKFDDKTILNDSYAKRKPVCKAILEELQAGRPVYARIPNGVYAGSIGRLKVKNVNFQKLSKIISERESGYTYSVKDRIKMEDLTWELELDGSNRTFKLKWDQIGSWKINPRPWTEIYLGRQEGTRTYKRDKEENLSPTLIDFMGREINDGDYVLAYSTYKELNDTGSPLRLVRYTGSRTKASALFVYMKMQEGKTEPGQKIRVNLNNAAHPDQVFGVKVDIDESLATAMQLTDNDVSMFPLKFSVSI